VEGDIMKKLAFLLSGTAPIIILFCLFQLSSKTASTEQTFRLRYVANEVLVKFKKDVDPNLFSQGIDYLQGKLVTYLGAELHPQERTSGNFSHRSFTGDPDLFLIRVPNYIGTEQAITILRSNPNVEYAERNLIMYPFTIDDPLFSNQWALDNTGQSGGTPDADIDAPEAWTICTGNPDIIVAVIGIGIDSTHPDLTANLWQNPFEIADNGLDDDHNNFVDDTRGWHFGNSVGQNNPDPPCDGSSSSKHETKIAGIIGASWNSIGVRGINQNVKIMNLRTDTIFVGITVANFINAMDYAVDNGAAIISCSQGWENSWLDEEDKQSFEAAIIRTKNRGVLFISAAGNCDSGWNDVDEDSAHHIYPGCFTEDNIINVMSTEKNDGLEQCTMWGATSVDLGAPGGAIWTTSNYACEPNPNKWYTSCSGTSFAAPHVAGVAALALGKCPALPYAMLKSRILNNGDPLSSLQGKCVSGKRLNAYNVVHELVTPAAPNAPSNLGAYTSTWNKVHLSWTDNSSIEAGFEVQRYTPDKPAFLRYQSCASDVQGFDDVWAYTRPGNVTYSYRVRAGNLGGMSSFSNTANVTMMYTSPVAPSDLAAQTFILPNIVLTKTFAVCPAACRGDECMPCRGGYKGGRKASLIHIGPCSAVCYK
jgi:subtilisin family serine protease